MKTFVNVALCVGVFCGVFFPLYSITSKPSPAKPVMALRMPTAWERVKPLVVQAERDGGSGLDTRLSAIPAFLKQRQQGTKAFARRILSLEGKWNLVKSKLYDEAEYNAWLRSEFNDRIFRGEELQQVVQDVVAAYLADLEAIESQLFVRIRADLANIAYSAPALQSDKVFKQEFDRTLVEVAALMDRDLQVTIGREVVSYIAGDIAAVILMRVGANALASMGVSAGILSAGAASTTVTLGIGLVASIVVDELLDWLLKAGGYDAETQVVNRVNQSLDSAGEAIINGENGLRAELMRLNNARARLRAATLERLVNEVKP